MTPTPHQRADTATIKVHNLLLAWHCIREHSPIGRIGVAERTGLSKGAMTSIVGDLLDLGLIKSVGEAAGVGRGRRVELLMPDGAGRAVVAVQIRKDTLVGEALDLGGASRFEATRPHGSPLGKPGIMADRIAELIAECRAHLQEEGCVIVGITLIMAAPLWGDPPIVPVAVDFGWVGVDLAQMVSDRLPDDVPVRLMNDAAAAAVAERDALPYRPRTMVYLKSNTGIGGAVFANGELLVGAHGAAFEPGHVVIDPAGPSCECGQRGCLAALAGPEAVLERAGLSALADEVGVLAALDEFVARYRDGDHVALSVGSDLVRDVARTVTMLRLLFDPDVVVLGGYWALLAKAVRNQLAEEWSQLGPFFATLWRTDLVRAAQVGEPAALAGAMSSGLDLAVGELVRP